MAELYGEEYEGAARCPGGGCPTWRSAAEEDRLLIRQNCTTCHGRGPLTADELNEIGDDESTKTIVARIESLARQRRAGRVLKLEELDALTWKLLVVWIAAEDAFNRAHQARLSALIKALTNSSSS